MTQHINISVHYKRVSEIRYVKRFIISPRIHTREHIDISYTRIMYVVMSVLPLILLSMSCLAASERNIICLPNQWQGIEMVTMDIGGYSTKVSNIITDTAPGGNVWQTRLFLLSTLQSLLALAYRDRYHELIDSVLLFRSYDNLQSLLNNVAESMHCTCWKRCLPCAYKTSVVNSKTCSDILSVFCCSNLINVI